MTKRHLTIATRKSPLALCQAEWVRDQLKKLHPHLTIEFLTITTQADQWLDVTLRQIGGKGLFVKELEEALLDQRADIAVHSMKDVPMSLPEDLILPVISAREEPRDAFVSTKYTSLAALPQNASVGTSSLRRQTQIKAIRSDLSLTDLRGNVNTRLAKLDQGQFDGIILAAAGLKRLGLDDRIRALLSVEQILPAAGQGALGIECRANDKAVRALIDPLHHPKTADCVLAERAVCRQLNGGCQIPIGAYATLRDDVLSLQALVASHDGLRIVRSHVIGLAEQAENIGKRAADELIQKGADKILSEFNVPLNPR